MWQKLKEAVKWFFPTFRMARLRFDSLEKSFDRLEKRLAVSKERIVNYEMCLDEPTLLPEPIMPPFGTSLERMRHYYKFKFLPDGYPAKFEDNEYFVHPSYGAYILKDYISQYHAKNSDKETLKDAIIKVADASISRMESLNGEALAFFFPAEAINLSYKHRHYSGLTQGRYLDLLYNAYNITGIKRYKDASKKVFNSLCIPTGKGGVLHKWDGGVSIEEVGDRRPHPFILNGWLTCLRQIHAYAKLSDSSEAYGLFNESVDSLAGILHLYDAEEVRNSRYALTGNQHYRFVFSPLAENIRIHKIELIISNESTFTIPVKDNVSTNRSENFIFEEDTVKDMRPVTIKNNRMTMNLNVSRISYPDENILCAAIETPCELTLKVMSHSGRYNPLAKNQVDKKWQEITQIELDKGMNNIRVPLSTNGAVVYPTNFTKKLFNKNYNVYHFTHIIALKDLYSVTGNKVLLDYANKWEAYTLEWPNMKLYKGVEHKSHYLGSE